MLNYDERKSELRIAALALQVFLRAFLEGAVLKDKVGSSTGRYWMGSLEPNMRDSLDSVNQGSESNILKVIRMCYLGINACCVWDEAVYGGLYRQVHGELLTWRQHKKEGRISDLIELEIKLFTFCEDYCKDNGIFITIPEDVSTAYLSITLNSSLQNLNDNIQPNLFKPILPILEDFFVLLKDLINSSSSTFEDSIITLLRKQIIP